MNFPPVEPGDRIQAATSDGPITVEAIRIVGPKETPSAVVWRQVGGNREGHFEYEMWQRCAYAQLMIATSKVPAGPADPDEYAKLYNALDEIGKLTSSVKVLEQLGTTMHTRYIGSAAHDLRTIRRIIKDITGKDYPEKSI